MTHSRRSATLLLVRSAQQKTQILGIDPGSHHLGLGCIEKEGNKTRLIFAQVLDAPAKASFYERVELINAKFIKILNELAPDEVAIEDIFFAKNARSAFRLGMARGVVIAPCLGRGIEIFEYAPAQVKAVVTGSGRADKAQVKKMVQLTLGEKIELPFDATDALEYLETGASSFQCTTGYLEYGNKIFEPILQGLADKLPETA